MPANLLLLLVGCPTPPTDATDLRDEITALQARLDARDLEIDALTAQMEALQARLPEGTSALATEDDLAAYVTSGQLDTTLLEYATQTYADDVAATAESNAVVYTDEVVGAVGDRVASIEEDFRRVSTDEVWEVDPSGSGDYTSLSDAVAALDGVWIDSDSSVTIHVASGTHTLSSALRIHSPWGDRVSIIGDEANAASVVLQFAGTDGFIIDGTSNLGYLAGVT